MNALADPSPSAVATAGDPSAAPPDALRDARLALRRALRALQADPQSMPAHLGRLQAARELPGTEPVQGALADLFCALTGADTGSRRAALQMAGDQLVAHVRRRFEALADGRALAVVTPLATRWSLLATGSAEVTTRARRVSPDDSRALAAQALAALQRGDREAEDLFLHHCSTCADALAFMLARMGARKAGLDLSPAWGDVGAVLEAQALAQSPGAAA